MSSVQPDLEKLKERMRSTWMSGDFGQIASYSAESAKEFVDRLNIQPGMTVLDVACGTGNLAIPAARKGARVSGVDIAPGLLDQARKRASEEGLHAVFEEGDAEQLNYSEAHFDVVMTMFGAMFAPRPEVVAAELARVCRPGGTIAMANWTAEGFVGKMFTVGSRHVPPPAGLPAPVLWGDERVVGDRLAPYALHIETARRTAAFDFPFPPAEVVQFFRKHFGPTLVAFSKLDAAGQEAYATDLESLWRDNDEGSDGRTLIRAEYLEVIAARR